MASNKKLLDLQWLLQAIDSESLDLQNLSFYLSQPTSGCLLETENSIHISISHDSFLLFSDILSSLTKSKKTLISLTNLEFHSLNWEIEELRIFAALLNTSLEIKRVFFRRNRFSTVCLSELCEILKGKTTIREIMFSESAIGSFGARVLASALKLNEGLEELQIWEDSIGSKGAEELSKMIESNSTLKVLTIFDSNSITATPLISAVLARNRTMEVHIWSKEDGEKVTKIVEFLPVNNTLRIYKLNVAGSCRVACALGWNSTVRSLDMTGILLKSRWGREFRWVLEQNHSLREVNLSKTCLKDKGAVYIAAGLFKNRHLESLNLAGNWFSGIGVEHLLCPFSRFSTLQIQANTTLTRLTFGGGRTKIGRNGLSAILVLLRTNQSLIRFQICDDKSLKPEDFVRIFKSLEKNESLRSLSLQGCNGVQGDLVLQTLMEILEVNPWIEDIDLSRTPLQNSGKTDKIHRRLSKNDRAEPEKDLLKNMPLTHPRSCRVFVFGQEYAGKSTLCNSISLHFSTSKLPYMDQIRSLVNPIEHSVRTAGMKIKILKDENTKISLWNLSGHHEFYSVHDLMFPGHGSSSIFFIVISLFRKPNNKEEKTPLEVEEDLHYWLRFLASNPKRAIPNVTLVLTHYDKIIQPSQNLTLILNSVQNLTTKFQGFVDFYPTLFTVDGRSSVSVNKLTHHLRKASKTILQRVPRVYELCNELVQILSDWRSENLNNPAMKWKEFEELCQVKSQPLRIRSRGNQKDKMETRRRTMAVCLHDMGEVIYFDELGILVLDCEWFYGDVLSQIIRLESRRMNLADKTGFICRKELEKIVRESLGSRIPGNLEASDLVRMMLKIELCYEQDKSDPDSPVFITFLLEDGRGKPQKWPTTELDCLFAGRHLECDDSSHMFLIPGFFPRLQVNLHNIIMGVKNQHGASYSVEKHLITITINGVFIRVELGGKLRYSIDLLLCSTKNLSESLRLMHQLIMPAIHGVCTGITMTENVIRPECVRNLISPRYRKTQAVSLQKLKRALLSVPADSMYDYKHTWEPVSDAGKQILTSGFDLARDLLSDEDFRDVLRNRYHDLYNLAVELQVPPENNHDVDNQTLSVNEQDKVEASFGGIAKGVEAVLQRLKIIEQEIRDLKMEIQGLRFYEHRLLIELHRKVNFIVNYNFDIEERKVPNLFYFVRTENYSRKLVTSMIPGMEALRIHMLCEFRREIHVVEEQFGCEMMKIENETVKLLAPYMTKFMKLLTFAIKIGAHLAAGMGQMIPDLSKEIAHLADSSIFYGTAGAAAAGMVGAAAMGRSGNMEEDQSRAQQWVLDFLRERECSTGKEIAEKFGLWRVRYWDNGCIAWVCRRHMTLRANEIVEVPI